MTAARAQAKAAAPMMTTVNMGGEISKEDRTEILTRNEMARRKFQAPDECIDLMMKEQNDRMKAKKLQMVKDLGVYESAEYAKLPRVGESCRDYVPIHSDGPVGLPRKLLGTGSVVQVAQKGMVPITGQMMGELALCFSIKELEEAQKALPGLMLLWSRCQQPPKRTQSLLMSYNYYWAESLRGARTPMLVALSLLIGRRTLREEADLKGEGLGVSSGAAERKQRETGVVMAAARGSTEGPARGCSSVQAGLRQVGMEEKKTKPEGTNMEEENTNPYTSGRRASTSGSRKVAAAASPMGRRTTTSSFKDAVDAASAEEEEGGANYREEMDEEFGHEGF